MGSRGQLIEGHDRTSSWGHTLNVTGVGIRTVQWTLLTDDCCVDPSGYVPSHHQFTYLILP